MIVLFTIQFLAIAFLGYKLYNFKKEKVVEQIKKEGIILPNPVGVPDFDIVDPNYKLLKDVIESIKLEKWEIDKFERDYDNTYDIDLKNGPGTLKIKCRIRVRDYDGRDSIHLSWFHIFKMVNSTQHSHTITYNDNNRNSKFLILNLMWDYILDHHQKIYDDHIEHYRNCKEAISKELKTLNRDNQLVKLLED
jgi:hypothetical protein